MHLYAVCERLDPKLGQPTYAVRCCIEGLNFFNPSLKHKDSKTTCSDSRATSLETQKARRFRNLGSYGTPLGNINSWSI